MNPDWFDKLGLMGWPLLMCSVIALTIIFERMVFMLIQARRQKKTLSVLSQSLYEHENQPKAIRDDLISLRLHEIQSPFEKGLKTLRIIGTVSPLFGLLGTVIGIIKAFQKIAASTGAVNPAMIADGLWEALLTTAVGLSIALPCLLAAQVYKAWGQRMCDMLCLELNRLSLSFELGKDDADIKQFPERKAA